MPVAIVCEPRLVRELLADLFARVPVTVCDACESVGRLAPLAPGDVVLLHRDGALEAVLADLRELRRRMPWASVVLLGGAWLSEARDQLGAAGAGAIITHESSTATLVGAVSVVQAGFRLIADHGAGDLPGGERHADGPANEPGEASDRWAGEARLAVVRPLRHAHPLSAQEVRILVKLVRGGSNKEIANELGIAEGTVKVHLRACYEKIGVRNRTQAAMWASLHLRRSA